MSHARLEILLFIAYLLDICTLRLKQVNYVQTFHPTRDIMLRLGFLIRSN